MSFVQQALVVRGGEGEVVTALGSRYLYKVLGGSTAGAFSLVEETLVGDGPPLHVHDGEEETFYVLEGTAVFLVGQERRELSAGDLVVVPRGVPHTLASTGATPLRMLVLVSPAGFEQFFVEVQRREGEDLDDDAVTALAAAHGCRIVGPPLDTAT
jgi:mannose-6-phosphate isomerase-like protein (cupin superfamily)